MKGNRGVILGLLEDLHRLYHGLPKRRTRGYFDDGPFLNFENKLPDPPRMKQEEEPKPKIHVAPPKPPIEFISSIKNHPKPTVTRFFMPKSLNTDEKENKESIITPSDMFSPISQAFKSPLDHETTKEIESITTNLAQDYRTEPLMDQSPKFPTFMNQQF